MAGERALVDANVWFSRSLRDWICLASIVSRDDLFEITWTEDILAEVVYHLRKRHPKSSDAAIGGVRDKIIATFPDGRIAGYVIDDSRDYPDRFDAHVIAAAEHGRVSYLVTDDRRGFVESDDLDYEVYTADEFLVLVDDSSPAVVDAVLEQQLDYWLNRAPDGFNLAGALRKAGAVEFSERIRRRLCSMHTLYVERP